MTLFFTLLQKGTSPKMQNYVLLSRKWDNRNNFNNIATGHTMQTCPVVSRYMSRYCTKSQSIQIHSKRDILRDMSRCEEYTSEKGILKTMSRYYVIEIIIPYVHNGTQRDIIKNYVPLLPP